MTVVSIHRHTRRITVPSGTHEDNKPRKRAYEAERVFKFLFYFALCPHKIVFDQTRGRYICVKAGKLRTAICVFCNLCVPINAVVHYGAEEVSSGTLSLMLKTAYVVYGIWGLSFTFVVWTRMEQITNIFNRFDELYNKVENRSNGKDTSFWKWDISKSIVYTIVGITFMKAIFENLASSYQIHQVIKKSGQCPGGCNAITLHLKEVGLHVLKSFRISIAIPHPPDPVLIVLAILHFFTNTWRGICFMHLDLLMICWAIQFRRIIKVILNNFQEEIEKCAQLNKAIGSEEKLQTIKSYMEFCALLEYFNKVQGLLVFTSTIAETIYVSLNSSSLVIETHANQMNHIVIMVSFFPFLLAILAPAEVHQMANKFGALMKQAFVQKLELMITSSPSSSPSESGATWEKEKAISDAMSYIQHDISTNSIGFQGLGFFTLSYGFLGTIVTVIGTYSLVVLQVHEKPNHD